jgi:hypothetical protein
LLTICPAGATELAAEQARQTLQGTFNRQPLALRLRYSADSSVCAMSVESSQ